MMTWFSERMLISYMVSCPTWSTNLGVQLIHCIRCTYFPHLQLDLYCAGDTNVTKEKLIAKSKFVAETKAAEKKSKKASQREIISEEDLSLDSAITPEKPQQTTVTFAPPMPHLARVFPKRKPEPKVSTALPNAYENKGRRIWFHWLPDNFCKEITAVLGTKIRERLTF